MISTGQEAGHNLASLTAHGLSHEVPFKVSTGDEVSPGSLTGRDPLSSSLLKLLAGFTSFRVVRLRASVASWLLARTSPQLPAMWAFPTWQLASSKAERWGLC